MTRLRQLPRDKGIIIKWFVDEETGKEIDITFHHIDWAYSYCTVWERVVHLSASTPLEKVNEWVYKLVLEHTKSEK
jgi:hypothetical protein